MIKPSDFLTTHRSIGGWRVVRYFVNDEGEIEPAATSGPFRTREGANQHATRWAAADGLVFATPSEKAPKGEIEPPRDLWGDAK